RSAPYRDIHSFPTRRSSDLVLEKHADFFRDFRGDTIHPSTLEVMHELGLLEEFLKLPHQELRELRGIFNGHPVPMADFSRLPTRSEEHTSELQSRGHLVCRL